MRPKWNYRTTDLLYHNQNPYSYVHVGKCKRGKNVRSRITLRWLCKICGVIVNLIVVSPFSFRKIAVLESSERDSVRATCMWIKNILPFVFFCHFFIQNQINFIKYNMLKAQVRFGCNPKIFAADWAHASCHHRHRRMKFGSDYGSKIKK